MQQLSYDRNKVINQGDHAARGNATTSNPAQQSTVRTMNPRDVGNFFEGQVVRSCAGSLDVEVMVGEERFPCRVLTQMTSYYMGTQDTFVPVEGSKVLVYKPNKGSGYGTILGVLPGADIGNPLPQDRKPLLAITTKLDQEPGMSYASEEAHAVPWEDTNYVQMINQQAGRAHDLMPGNRAWANEQGVSMALLNLMLSLRASDRAKIELGVLDDTIRIVSGYMRHISAQGEEQIYNDGGFVTRICTGTSWQSEKSGFRDIGTEMTVEDEGVTDNKTDYIRESVKSRYNLVEPDLESKKRFQWMAGHLGDILNYFVANPDPNVNPETRSNDSKDQGLLHTHVDSSGRVFVRSAGGISFQRWDRIPIPKRKFDPWDPAGDKLEDDNPIQDKLPFELPEGHPYARSLILRDMMAWYHKHGYQRIHEIAQSTSHRDFYLPEERDLVTPVDRYDPQGKATEKFQANDKRSSFFNLEPDGSVIIRDAWGSEIIMRGGNIIFNCAGQLELRSGGSIVQLAGHDIVAKARKSVDITATDNDVRVKANSNLHLLSEGRQGSSSSSSAGGGILLESKSRSDGFNYDSSGEQTFSTGIVLKADNSRVYMRGQTTHLSASRQLLMDTKDQLQEENGVILVSSANIQIASDNSTSIISGDKSGVLIWPQTVALVGSNTYMVAEFGLGLFYKDKVMMGFSMAIDDPPYPRLKEIITEIHTRLVDEDAWLGAYTADAVVDIEFTYRSSEEYGTVRATEVQGATQFYVYQAAWAYLKGAGDTMLAGVQIAQWEDYPAGDTYAWPGANYYGSSGEAYVKYDEEVNIEDVAGIPKIRRELVGNAGTLTPVGFSEYEVVRH